MMFLGNVEITVCSQATLEAKAIPTLSPFALINLILVMSFSALLRYGV